MTGTLPAAWSTHHSTARLCSSCERVGLSPVVPTGTRPLVPSASCQSTRPRNAFSSSVSPLNGVTSAVKDPRKFVLADMLQTPVSCLPGRTGGRTIDVPVQGRSSPLPRFRRGRSRLSGPGRLVLRQSYQGKTVRGSGLAALGETGHLPIKIRSGLMPALTLAGIAWYGPAADAAASAKVPLPRARPTAASPRPASQSVPTAHKAAAAASVAPLALASAASNPVIPSLDTGNLKEAITLARQSKTTRATELQQTIGDPVARKLVEWAILRSDDNGANFSRYAAFIAANPSWASLHVMRRRAEAMLWHEGRDAATVRGFFAKWEPLTARGRFALARTLLSQGDRAGAQEQVREAWWNDSFGADLESQGLETFGELITAGDHKSRMDMRLYAEDVEGAMRSARRLGGNALLIAT